MFLRTLPINGRRACRSARAKPAYAVAIVATVSLVMCAAAMAFTVFDVTMLRPLPYPDDSRLVVVYTLPPGMADARFRNPLHSIDLVRVRDRARTLAAFEGIVVREHSVATGAEPEVARVGHVSAGFHRMLGLPIAPGRGFTAAEDRNQAPVAVLGHALASRAFGDAGASLGRKLLIDGEPHEIIGVADRQVRVPFAETDLWVPLGISDANLPQPAATFVQGIGRLADGSSIAAAGEEVRALIGELGREWPTTHHGWTAGVLSLREWQFGDNRQAIGMLAAAAAFVLLIAWSNLFNLVVADTLSRRAELKMTLALGASRGDVVATQLTAIALLLGTGTFTGLMLAASALPMVQSAVGTSLPGLGPLRLDARVEMLAAALTIVAALCAAFLPLRRALAGSVMESGRVVGSKRDRFVRVGLVAMQTTLVVALIACALLFGRTLYLQHRRPIGLNPERVLAVQLRMPARLYASVSERARAVANMVAGLRQLPGVVAAASVTNPLTPGAAIATLIDVEDRPTADGKPSPVQVRMISSDYFRTMEIPILSGRPIGAEDSDQSAPVAVVSRALAEKLWPGGDPLGRRLRRHILDPRWMRVVGVAGDVSDIRVGQAPEPILYTAYAQFNAEVAPVALVVRTTGDPAQLGSSTRRAIAALSPLQPIYQVQPLTKFVDDSLAPQRFRTWALAAITGLGLLLAAVGIHGIVSRTAAERLVEIGIRKALGASAWRASAIGARDVLTGVGVGIALSVPATLFLARLMNVALPTAARLDAATYGAAVGVALAATSVATMVPLRRAVSLEPLRALRTG